MSSEPIHKIIVNKSTVPIGTTKLTEEILREQLGEHYRDELFTVVSMPEFLAEGQAVNNIVNPDRVVIGTPNTAIGLQSFELLKTLFQGKSDSEKRIVNVINTKQASSELGKLMSNAMLAQRISSINSISALSEKFENCDIDEVKQIVQADSRIGDKYLSAGPGFGGSCFEKDLLSLIHILDSNGEHQAALYWQSVLDMNNYQKQRLARMITDDIKLANSGLTTQVQPVESEQSLTLDGGVLGNQEYELPFVPTVCIFGFSFKKNTGDARMSQAAFIINYISQIEGMNVHVHDPQVSPQTFEIEMEAQGFPLPTEATTDDSDTSKADASIISTTSGQVKFFGNDYKSAVCGCQAIVILTEWDEFKDYDYSEIATLMEDQPESTDQNKEEKAT